MAKIKNPLLSLGAVGRLAKDLALRRRGKVNIIETKPIPTDAKSPSQLAWRHMYQKAVDLWHALSAAEKQEWESMARPKHMTGFAWFMSQCLRPNPGIYLPLQGGVMSGEIDMTKNRILKLPLPVDDQEPLTIEYFTAYIAPYIYHEAARVYRTAAYSIPHNDWTVIPFTDKRYETAGIWDADVNPSRLTCIKAGKHLIIANIGFDPNAVGRRTVTILLNGTTRIGGVTSTSPTAAAGEEMIASTIYLLQVGHYVEVEVYQNSGGALDAFVAAQRFPEFMIQRIGV